MEKIRYLHRPPEPDPKVMSFIDHLQELRFRLMIMAGSVVAFSILGWFLEPYVFNTLAAPLLSALKAHHNFIDKVVYSSIVGAFTLKLKLSIITGVVLSIPILVQQAWGFVVPALPKSLYRFGPYVMVAGVLLFVAGGLTGYKIMPLAITFFVSQASNSTAFVPEASNYVSFVSLIVLVFGVSFEMPLVLVLLCLAGITNSGWLWRKRVVAFFIIFAVSTVITPGADWISPLILGGMLFILYLTSLVVAKALGH